MDCLPRVASLPGASARRAAAVRGAMLALALGALFTPVAGRPEATLPPVCGGAPSIDEVLLRLNAMRARGAVCRRAGEREVAAPVHWSASLATVAATQSLEMALLDRMGHVDRHDRGLAERLAAGGYRFSTAVENVAVGYDSLDEVVDAWLDSEPHCENLMNDRVSEFGLACVDGRTRDDRYWTLVLGAPRRAR